MKKWLKYFVAKGPYREDFINAGPGGDEDYSDSRSRIAGFRLLKYEDDKAAVDMGMEISLKGQSVSLSMVYDLIWEDGDWKMAINDQKKSVKVANLPDLYGYIPWEEQYITGALKGSSIHSELVTVPDPTGHSSDRATTTSPPEPGPWSAQTAPLFTPV